MAVQVGGTTVIDNSRVLQNIAGANGRYDSFHAAPTTLVSNPNVSVSMNNPIMLLTLAGNAVLTPTDLATGKTSILALNTGASAFTPSWASSVSWANGSEPDWSSYRHWNVALVAWDGTNVRAAAVGYSS